MCCYRCQLFYIQHWQPFYLFSIFTTFRVTFFVKWFVFKNNQCSKRVYYMTNNSKNIQLLMNLLTEFAKDGYNSDGALKFHHIYILDTGNNVLLSSWDIPMATTISVHNTYVCQPKIYFVDNDAEYVLFVVFGCLRYSLKLSVMNYGFLDNQIYFHIVFISYDT